MPTVRCPSCRTAQSIDASARGYRCSSCGKQWGFVVCRSCGSRFHAKPGSTTWRCPRCGLLQDASAEQPRELPEPAPAQVPAAKPRSVTISDADLDRPQQPPGSAFPPGIGLGNDDEGPQDAFAMPYRASSRRPVWLWIVAGLAAVVLVVVLLILFRSGDGGDPDAVSADEAVATMCTHVQQTQALREQALAQAQETLRADARALRRAGDTETAEEVLALIAATGHLRRALADQEPTADELRAQGEAIAALPCGG